ncbi:hypothetical protein RCL1_003868 [Eukaryota sp. TZLM3-RCL]
MTTKDEFMFSPEGTRDQRGSSIGYDHGYIVDEEQLKRRSADLFAGIPDKKPCIDESPTSNSQLSLNNSSFTNTIPSQKPSQTLRLPSKLKPPPPLIPLKSTSKAFVPASQMPSSISSTATTVVSSPPFLPPPPLVSKSEPTVKVPPPLKPLKALKALSRKQPILKPSKPLVAPKNPPTAPPQPPCIPTPTPLTTPKEPPPLRPPPPLTPLVPVPVVLASNCNQNQNQLIPKIGNKSCYYSCQNFKYYESIIIEVEKNDYELSIFLKFDCEISIIELIIPEISWFFELSYSVGDHVTILTYFDRDWPFDRLAQNARISLTNDLFLILNPDILVPVTTIAQALDKPYDCLRLSILNKLIKSNESSANMVLGSISHELFQLVAEILEKSENFDGNFDSDARSKIIDGLVNKHAKSIISAGLDVSDLFPLLLLQFDRVLSTIAHFKSQSNVGGLLTFEEKSLSFLASELRISNHRLGLIGYLDMIAVGLQKGSTDYSVFPVEIKTSRRALENSNFRPKIRQSHHNQSNLYCLILSEFLGLSYQKMQSFLIYLGPELIENSVHLNNPRINELPVLLAVRNQLAQYLRPKLPIFELSPINLPPPNGNCSACFSNSLCFLSRIVMEQKPFDDIESLSSSAIQLKSTVDMSSIKFLNYFLKTNNSKFNSSNDSFLKKEPKIVLKFSELLSITDSISVFDLLHSKFPIKFSKISQNSDDCDVGSSYWISVHQRHNQSIIFDPILCGSCLAVGEVVESDPCHVTLLSRFPFLIEVITTLIRLQSISSVELNQNLKNYLENFEFRIDLFSYTYDDSSLLNSSLLKLLSNDRKKFHSSVVSLEAPKFHSNIDFSGLSNFCDSRFTQSNPIIESLLALKFDWSCLNLHQRRALHYSLTFQDYFLIFGMPGSGKSRTLSFIVAALLATGHKVLVTANSNAAVDSVFQKILDLFKNLPNFALFRVGSDTKFPSNILPLDLHPNKLLELVTSAHVMAATIASTLNNSIFSIFKPDVVIMDEASQCDIPSALSVCCLGTRFILVGDHLQLAPITQSIKIDSNITSNYSSFDSLFCYLGHNHPNSIVTLPLQYRMNQQIMDLANHLIYSGQLKSLEVKVIRGKIELQNFNSFCQANIYHWICKILDPNLSIIFLDTDAVGENESIVQNSVVNYAEAKICYLLVECFTKLGVLPSEIAVISPYKAQINAIRQLVSSYIKVDTVDAFQGSECDITLISFVRSNDQAVLGKLLPDWRRVNVAITRAKKKLVFVGSRKVLSTNYLLKELIEFCIAQRCFQVLPSQAHLLDQIKFP